MRRLRSLLVEERGSASLEFIGAGLILLIPLIYLIITLAQIQGQSLGIEAAARHVARVISQHPETAGSAQQTANLIAEQYGIDPAGLTVSITCPESFQCPAPGSLMTVTVTTHTQLPLVPQALGVGDITLSTTSTHLLAETP